MFSAAAAPPERFNCGSERVGVRPNWKEKTGTPENCQSRPGREK